MEARLAFLVLLVAAGEARPCRDEAHPRPLPSPPAATAYPLQQKSNCLLQALPVAPRTTCSTLCPALALLAQTANTASLRQQ